jgi:hypothetical protein
MFSLLFKSFLKEHQIDSDTIIIVSQDFYTAHKHMIDTNYVVHQDDNGDGIILSQGTDEIETPQSPCETLTSLAE